MHLISVIAARIVNMSKGLFDGAGQAALMGAFVAVLAGIFYVIVAAAKKRGRFNPDLGKNAGYWIMAGVVVVFAAFIGIMVVTAK
jgi:hypothetical protein